MPFPDEILDFIAAEIGWNLWRRERLLNQMT